MGVQKIVNERLEKIIETLKMTLRKNFHEINASLPTSWSKKNFNIQKVCKVGTQNSHRPSASTKAVFCGIKGGLLNAT